MGYTTDLTDRQWAIIEPIFTSKKGQHFSKHAKRDLINAVLYLVKTGCQWRLLPNDFPPHDAVWSLYRRAVKSGKWEKAMDMLVKKTRQDAGRNPEPSYGLIDSRSAKTTLVSNDRGFDGGKKVKGRKRHIVVDIMGNSLAITVHAANTHDTKSGIKPTQKACRKYSTIQKFCGDDGYRKSFEEDVLKQLGLLVDISKRIKPQFEVLPKHWRVERTFSPGPIIPADSLKIMKSKPFMRRIGPFLYLKAHFLVGIPIFRLYDACPQCKAQRLRHIPFPVHE